MIVILYDPESNTTHEIAKKIELGIENENRLCVLMDLADVEINTLISAKAIVFGCHAGFSPGVSQSMVRFMNYTKTDIFENQVFKNKFAAGFTTRSGYDSTGIIEDMLVFGAGIPDGATVENIATLVITLSEAATASASSVPVKFVTPADLLKTDVAYWVFEH